MTEQAPDDVPALPDADLGTRDADQPSQGDNQDVAARRIYPTDPTGADPA
ncbi:hypothetical protein [Cellulomonas sp. URHB0016]